MSDGTVSHVDLPVSAKARDLYERYVRAIVLKEDGLAILAAAEPDTVRALLWARRAGKL
jgi:regulator of extracellular matrix RemA (YlzA/DUF370 family)